MQPISECALLSTAYHAPIQYYSKLFRYKQVYIEQWENYQKQSYRNRCHILSANGVLALTVPIVHTGSKMCIRDVKIDNSKRWKAMHLRAIESAYRSSPFYIYYYDEFEKIYQKPSVFLWDMNQAFLELTLQLLNIQPSIQLTNNYHEIEGPYDDFSQNIHPKAKFSLPDHSFKNKPYFQVFENKFGFVENLSILDLLFNTGPEAINWL
ncbi:MAG: WbqC family protein [Bacteroidales bacterium]|nr:WbqC family protein [Bacteroidales bacterium]